MGNMKFTKDKSTKTKDDASWKILIVDDEPEVHSMTKTVLSRFELDGRKLEFLSAYDGKEAIEILKNTQDIVLVLLDVVMETNDAGLIVVKRIREELNNDLIRVILRTGQPGSAPEEEVIVKYRINDYKEKTELTSKKLFSTMVTAIRSYQDLATIKKSKDGLEKVIEATKSISEERSLNIFAEDVLGQLISIINLNNTSTNDTNNALVVEKQNSDFQIIATSGSFTNKINFSTLDKNVIDLVTTAITNEKSDFSQDNYVGYFKFNNEISYVIYISDCKNTNLLDRNLAEIFSNNIAIAFNNISLNNEILCTQKEILERLGEVVEKRSKEASKHVYRVSEITYVLAKDYGLSDDEAILLRMASPMHDVGKIGISDSILLKPGALTPEEFEIMKTHSVIGYKILKNSKRDIIKAAATIAYEHHEKWDGSGYPRGLKGEDIHIYGRISAIADVFDALYHKRCYKEAWPLEDIIELFEKQRGKHFDPKLIDLVLKNIDSYTSIIKYV